MPNRPPLSVGFIGGGINSAVGQTHFAASQLDGHWKLAAGAFSRNADVNARTALCWNVPSERTYHSWRDLIAAETGKLDAVALLTPTPNHAEMLEALLDAGIPIICEKAMVSSLEDGETVLRQCMEHEAFLGVTYNYSGYPMVRELQARIARGDLGRILQIHLEMPQEGFARPPDIAGEAKPPQSWRLRDQHIPTICLDLGVHLHQMASFLTHEEPTSVAAEFNHYSTFPDIVDDVMMWMRYDSGMRSSYWMTKTAIGNRNGLRVRVFGELGSAEWFQQDSELLRLSMIDGSHVLIDRGGKAIVASEARYNRMKVGHPSGFIEAFANLYADLADAVWARKGKGKVGHPFVFGPDTALKGLQLFHRARDAFSQAQWMDL